MSEENSILRSFWNDVYKNALQFNKIDLSQQASQNARYIHECTDELIIPEYNLTEEKVIEGSVGKKTTVKLSINNDDYQDSVSYVSTTIKSEEFDFIGVEKKNFIHDYVFEILSSETDYPLSKWVKMFDADDDLTPDFYTKNSEFNIFIEFTTNMSNFANSMIENVKTKLEKYTGPIETRMKFKNNRLVMADKETSILLVIVVSFNKVVSNFPISSKDLISELCLRYRLAVDVEKHLEKMGLVQSQKNQEVTDGMEKIKRMFNSIQYKPNFSPILGRCLIKENMSNFVNTPLDKEKVNNIIEQILKKSKENIEKDISERNNGKEQSDVTFTTLFSEEDIRNNENLTRASIKKYKEKFDEDKSKFREDLKSVVHFPAIDVQKDFSSFNSTVNYDKVMNDLPLISDDDENATIAIWKQVITKIYTNEVRMDDESVDEQHLRALNPDKYNDPKSRRNYHRVTVDLSNDKLIDCAKIGMWSKNYLSHSAVESYRLQAKKPFHIDTPIDDIEDFICKKGMDLFEDGTGTHPTTDNIIGIIRDSLNLHGNEEITSKMIKVTEKLLSTKFMIWMKLISDIATEISISLKQHVNKQEFIIKKVKDTNVFILIRTTSQEGLVNYSLCWRKEEEYSRINSTIFPSIIETEEYYMTEFRSVNIDKLHNLNLAESMMFNITFFYLNEYKINIFSDDFHFDNLDDEMLQEAKRMILFSTLCFLEDKKQTETIITNIRYVYMEGFVAYPKIPNPGKMICKLPENPKSRLSIFVINKSLDLINYIASGKYFSPIKRVTSQGEISSVRKNIINFITGSEIENLNLMINLMYVGYLNNKHELMQGNKVNSLYRKIIEMEMKFTKDIQANIGIVDHESLENIEVHDYSISMLKYALNISLNRLKATRGQNIKELIEDDILRKFSLINTTSVFGTLKSSSTFDSENDFTFDIDDISSFASKEDRKRLFKENSRPTRTKVLMAAEKNLIKYPNYADLLLNSMSIANDRDRLDVDLFDKAQHGGIREIFILNIEDRIIQHGIELISRVICSYFPSEMMTNSANKDTHLDNHKINSSKLFGKHGSIFVACSDDAEKWNQAHFVGKFAQTLCWFTPSYMWPFICNVIDLWFKRRIKIDSRLIQIMEQHEDLIVEDDIFQELYNIYKGRSKATSWYTGKKRRYIEIKSGFMQGILHYNSSLFHVITLELVMEIANILIKKLLDKMNLSWKFKMINYMVSSDDSSLFMTLPANNITELKNSLISSAFIFEVKTWIGYSLGIYKSIKSTQNTIHCMEFNSIFNFSESRYQAYIKQVIASTTMSEKDSLVARQEEQSTSLTAILENGGSNLLCSFCQIGQSFLFYRMLGSSTVPIITRVITPKLMEFRDPSLGYFLLDNPLICGIMGFKYNLWNLTQEDSTISGLYKYMLNNALAKDAQDIITSKRMDLTTTKTGLFTNSLIIPYGENAKLSRAQEQLNADKSIYDVINENPFVLYKHPDTSESVKIHLQLKLLSPGVTEAFSRGMGVTKIIAQSVYLTTNAILSESSNWFSNSSTLRSKTSLLKRLAETVSLKDSLCDGLNNHEIQLLFPATGDFERIKGNVNMIQHINLIPKIKHTRNVKTKIQITDHESYIVPPTQLIAWKWFNKRIPYTTRVLNDLWERLSLAVNWLKSTPDETLKNSPFSNQHQIQNFFARLQEKSRFIRLIGSPVNTGSSSSNIYTVACRNIWNGYEIPLIFDSDKKFKYDEYQSIRHSIFMVLNSPYTKKAKLEVVEDILLNSKKLVYLDKSYSNKRSALSALREFVFLKNKSDADVKEFVMHMLKYKYGVLGGFVVRQNYEFDRNLKKPKYTGKGIWSGQIGTTKVELHIDTDYIKNPDNPVNYLTALYINRRQLKPEFLEDLRKLCDDLGVLNFKPSYIDKSIISFQKLSYLKNFTISKIGAPIYFKPEITSMNDLKTLDELSLELNRSTLNVKYTGKSCWYNLISYTVSSSDFDLTLPKEVYDRFKLKHFIHSWIKNIPFDIRPLTGLIEKMRTDPFYYSDLNKDDFQNWAHDCFLSALSRQGVIKEKKLINISSDEPKPTDISAKEPANETYEFFETLLDNFELTENDFSEFIYEEADDLENYDEEFNIEEITEDLAEVLFGLQKEVKESQVLQTNDNIRKNNGTFQKLASHYLDIIGKREMRWLVNYKIIIKPIQEDLLEIIAYLLKCDVKDFKKSEMQYIKVDVEPDVMSSFI